MHFRPKNPEWKHFFLRTASERQRLRHETCARACGEADFRPPGRVLQGSVPPEEAAEELRGHGKLLCLLPAADDESSWREAIFEIALHLFLADKSVADRTKRIFERTALNGESPETVATAFKMTRHAVDQVKSRAMARLRTLVKELESIADG